ncbi:MAG: glycoside hydrolase family 76 protein [Bacteroidales bacterium]
MKNLCIYILIATTCLFYSCENIEDEYMYGKGLYPIHWNEVADSSSVTLQNRFWNPTAHYFNNGSDESSLSWGYWPQAHAMDVLIDAFIRTKDSNYSALFDQWYTGIKQKNGNRYWNEFNDDMEWIALTMLRLYEVTDDTKYLETAQELWGYINAQWNDEYAFGGIAWKNDQPWSKNACSNGPASILASRLYKITKNEDDKKRAIEIYEWEKEHLFNMATGAVYDNINGQTGEIGKFSLSYNQGTFIGAAHELYKLTNDKTYLNDARKAANFCISNSSMIDTGNNVLRDEGNGDGALFKGLFMRYFVELILEKDLDPIYKKKFYTFFNNNAEVLWRRGVRKNDILFNSNWTSAPGLSTELNAQVSGCTLIEARAYYERMK